MSVTHSLWIGQFAAVVLGSAIVAAPAFAIDLPASLNDGLSSRIKLSGVADIGSSRTSSVSLTGELDYRRGPFELQLDTRYQRSEARVDVARLDANDQPVIDADGQTSTDQVSERTRDRRFLSAEPRWYLRNDELFAFGLLDVDRDVPGGVELSTRQIVGVGYRLWENKNRFLAAGIGVGNKRFRGISGDSSEGGIGYFGIKLVLDTSDRTRVRSELDADFGGDNGLVEFSLSFDVDVNESVALSLGYEARVTDLGDTSADSEDDLQSRFEVGLEVRIP